MRRQVAQLVVERHFRTTVRDDGEHLVPGRTDESGAREDRPDGLSPAGECMQIVLDDARPLQDYGCFMPEDYDPFAVPTGA